MTALRPIEASTDAISYGSNTSAPDVGVGTSVPALRAPGGPVGGQAAYKSRAGATTPASARTFKGTASAFGEGFWSGLPL